MSRTVEHALARRPFARIMPERIEQPVFRSQTNHCRTVRVQFDLRGLRTILWSGSRKLKRLLLNQQAFGLEQKLKVDDGLHPGPLVPDRFKTLQYASPLVAPTAQHHLSNKPHGVVYAAQHPLWVRADAQRRINRKVRHE